MYIGLFAVGITCLVTYLSSSKGDKPAQSQEKQEKQTQVVQSVCVSKDEQQTSKTIVKEENSKKEPTQSPKVQAKQNLSEIDKSSYAVVTRSVEIHKNDLPWIIEYDESKIDTSKYITTRKKIKKQDKIKLEPVIFDGYEIYIGKNNYFASNFFFLFHSFCVHF